jgi:O-antigen/teichoic acid export membrane protein
VSIERRAISALKWATTAKLVVQIVSWAGTLVVVRLLAPEDYGLMAKVGVVCGVATTLAEFGLEAAIVRAAEIARDDLRKVYGVSLLLGAGMTIALSAAAPLFALLFQDSRLTAPIACASLQILVGAVAMVPSAIWTRDLSFRNLAKVEMATGVTSISMTLLLAALGFGVWALVLGTLFGAISRMTMLLMFGERVWPPLFSASGIAEHLKFGLTVVAGRVSYFVLVQSDVLIGSAFLSTAEIGFYSVALQLATLPMAKVMGTVNQIALPAVARQQDDLARVRSGTLKAISILSLIAFPALWGISAVAPELVRVLFGERWLQAIPGLTILPLVVPIRMIFSMLFTTSLALGNRALDLRNTIANFILLPVGFFIGARWGLVGLCLAWLVAVPIAYLFSVPAVMRFIGVNARALLEEVGPPALAAAVMYAAVVFVRPTLVGQSAITTLVTLSLLGAVVYFALMMLISRRHLIRALSFAQTVLSRNTAGSQDVASQDGNA